MVSVLFADLVGFTTLSESRDAEEVRELLSKYFDTCRTLITRYGGVVEKFIGDAVMAVWGTPIATEDDAERAVRAALDLVDGVAALGEEAGSPTLRVRAGVLTGEAAVTLGARARAWWPATSSTPPPGSSRSPRRGRCTSGESTRRATEATIAYEDAGSFELKGKAEPVPLWRARPRRRRRVGARSSPAGLEAPFVGRDRELRMVKELFHASTEESRAHLVSVVGIAGIGKSRLVWEFYKYFDGLVEALLVHRGRCLSYGEGVTYWALAEMVRMRAGIAEEEEPASALAKLRASLERERPGSRGAALASNPGSPTSSAWRSGPLATARTCSARGACSSNAWPSETRRSWCSRTCSGPTRRCSTSSSTSWSGRGTSRCSS